MKLSRNIAKERNHPAGKKKKKEFQKISGLLQTNRLHYSDVENWAEDTLIRKGSVVHSLAISAQKFKEKDKANKQRFAAMGNRSSRKGSTKLGWMRKDRRNQNLSNTGGEEPMNVAQAVAASPALLRLQQRGSGNTYYII